MNKLGKVAVALAMAFSVGAAMTASAKEYVLKEGDDLEATLVTTRADWAASETDPKEPSVITLGKGTYTLTQEMYLDWPVTLVGATGDPDDVVVEGNKKFRICTINHADAEVKDLTIAKGHYANEAGVDGKPPYNWGNAGVRICAPGSGDRTATSWHSCSYGKGGKLTHCVVRDCETPYFHCWGTLYLNGPKDKTIVDRCVIRNNTHSGQDNGQKGKGDIVTVESGIFSNSLVKDNTTTLTSTAAPSAPYQGIVTVCGANGEIVGCTVANNWQKGVNKHMVAGVLATAGKVINTIIANNRIDGPTAARDRVWHGTASCFVNCVADWPEPINETCFGGFDAGLVDAPNGNFDLCDESAAIGNGSKDATTACGDLDLAGQPRLRGGVLDIGAYVYNTNLDPSVRFASTLEGEGHAPQPVSFVAYSTGLGSPLKYHWQFDTGAEKWEAVTDENTYSNDFPMGEYTVTVVASNEYAEASSAATRENLFQVRIGEGTYEIDPVKDGADAFQRKYDEISALEGARGTRQTFVLLPGRHLITNEVMLTCPWQVYGSTGRARDVIVDVQKKNKAFCLNNAKAVLASLTVTNGLCNEVNSYGIVRICNPRGRGNGTNSDMGGAVNGGLVSNVVMTSCSCSGKLAASVLYVKGGTATHCEITGCTSGPQQDSNGNMGMSLLVAGGTVRNTLVRKNTITLYNSGSSSGQCLGTVAVTGGSLVNCTVWGNKVTNTPLIGCAGIRASGGRVVNALVAGNTSGSTNPHYSQWSGATNLFLNCFTDTDEPINDTCVAAADAKIVAPSAGYFQPDKSSPCRAAGTLDATYKYGDTDLAFRLRTAGTDEEPTIDIGAYQYDANAVVMTANQVLPDLFYDSIRVTVNIEAGGFGDEPVYYYDFNSDGVADVVTTEPSITQTLGVGAYHITVTTSNLVDGVGRTITIGEEGFEVVPHPVHYVNVNGTNPVSPFLTPETAATNIQEAINVAGRGDEVVIAAGRYEVLTNILIKTDMLNVHGETGDPNDVVIRNVSTKNEVNFENYGRDRCLLLDAGPATIVHSMTFAGAKTATSVYPFGQGVYMGKDFMGTTGNSTHLQQGKGGIVSNCVVRNCSNGSKFGRCPSVFMYGPNYLMTHCWVTNNTSGSSNIDGGNFTGIAIDANGGARIENTLVANNRSSCNAAVTSGRGHAAVALRGTAKMMFCSVVGNRCSAVGGINIGGSGVTVRHCVVAGNTAIEPAYVAKEEPVDVERYDAFGVYSLGYGDNFISGNTPAGQASSLARMKEETARYREHPEIVETASQTNATDVLQMGSTSLLAETERLIRNLEKKDYRLPPGSPARDVVPPETLPEFKDGKDLIGNRRLDNFAYDLGCLESIFRGFMLLVK